MSVCKFFPDWLCSISRRRLLLCCVIMLLVSTPIYADDFLKSTGIIVPDIEKEVTVVLKAKDEAILSSRISGQVIDVPVELGNKIKKGDLLIAIKDNQYISELRKAGAVYDAATKRYNMSDDMMSSGDLSTFDFVTAERDMIVSEEAVKIAKEDLDACRILAPYSGRVVEVFVKEHELVENQQPLIKVVDDKKLLAHFLVPHKLFNLVNEGDEVELTITSTDSIVKAKVCNIAAVLDSASRRFDVYAEVDNSSDALRVGMCGKVKLAQFGKGADVSK